MAEMVANLERMLIMHGMAGIIKLALGALMEEQQAA